jgi:aldehyde:ferredoxin oxidoreductase
MDTVAGEIQKLRWKLRVKTGYSPENVSIPKRFTEITTWKGQIDSVFLAALKDQYAIAIRALAGADTDSVENVYGTKAGI